ncbi:hypothetical protein SAMD00023353_7300100 [Rosellinia necatrix]|uniref:Uncharacterized protein n=1 Tax=Rosellinia necatrix TaxID=77044 RepID=A0A1S8AAQ3_ROSNE|nr:hypothetical protein SAMD00023353_7300100 [Rosellinia necatrix]
MCIEVYNLFGDASCRHKEYQNTFPCHIARRCRATDDQLLKEPIFLPARPPNLPPGLLGCQMRRATRPVTGKCRICHKKESRAEKASGNESSNNNINNNNNNDNNDSAGATAPPTPASLVESPKSTGRIFRLLKSNMLG